MKFASRGFEVKLFQKPRGATFHVFSGTPDTIYPVIGNHSLSTGCAFCFVVRKAASVLSNKC